MSAQNSGEGGDRRSRAGGAELPREVLTLDAGRTSYLSAEQLAALGLDRAAPLDASPDVPVGTPKGPDAKPPATPVATPKSASATPPATPVGTPKSTSGTPATPVGTPKSGHGTMPARTLASPKGAQGTPPWSPRP